MAAAYRPHVIALFHADRITNGTLAEIKQAYPECRIIDIDCDLVEPPARFARVSARSSAVHATLITSGGTALERLRVAGFRAGYVPNPTDECIDLPGQSAAQEKTWDLVYVASQNRKSSRWDLIRSIESAAPDLRVGKFGADKQRVLGRAYFDLLAASKAALNWSARNDIPLYSSDRIAQLFGSGTCVCLPRSSGFDKFIDAGSAVFFASDEDLVPRLRDAVQSGEWEEIGQAGRRRYTTLFNETRVAQYVLDFLFERPTNDYEWGDE
ncbi:MAG: glycosyltransferase [Hyphomicrobiaceae bacterium]|nr:glycosyltransferase [Hyphomicrobiaceae bacterium]